MGLLSASPHFLLYDYAHAFSPNRQAANGGVRDLVAVEQVAAAGVAQVLRRGAWRAAQAGGREAVAARSC